MSNYLFIIIIIIVIEVTKATSPKNHQLKLVANLFTELILKLIEERNIPRKGKAGDLRQDV